MTNFGVVGCNVWSLTDSGGLHGGADWRDGAIFSKSKFVIKIIKIELITSIIDSYYGVVVVST